MANRLYKMEVEGSSMGVLGARDQHERSGRNRTPVLGLQ